MKHIKIAFMLLAVVLVTGSAFTSMNQTKDFYKFDSGLGTIDEFDAWVPSEEGCSGTVTLCEIYVEANGDHPLQTPFENLRDDSNTFTVIQSGYDDGDVIGRTNP